MENLKHTKGEWYVSDFKGDKGYTHYIASKSEFGDVAKVFGGIGDSAIQAEANAKLIAAAPRTTESLMKMVSLVTVYLAEVHPELWTEARKALDILKDATGITSRELAIAIKKATE